MTWRDLVGEAWRNVRTGAARPLTAAALLGLVLVALAWLDISQVAALNREATAYRDGGGATYVIKAENAISGRRCDALARIGGVTGAGAMRATTTPVTPRTTPRTSIPLYEATPGLGRLLNRNFASGYALDGATADSLGIRAGSPLASTTGSVPITATYSYPDDGRDPTLAYALVRVGQAEAIYDQCWVAMWPPSYETGIQLLRSTLTDPATKDVQVGSLNGRFGQDFDLPARFAARTGRFAVGAALVAGFVVAGMFGWRRRLELSFDRHLGLSRTHVTALLVTETAIVGVAALLLGAGLVAMLAALAGMPSAWTFGVRVLSAGLLGAMLGSAAVGLLIDERRVFAYFKSR